MLRARETFHTETVTVLAGDTFGDRDEIVKGREDLFEKADRRGRTTTPDETSSDDEA
jgi:hypothetical protein